MLGCWRGSIGTTQRRVFWHCLAMFEQSRIAAWRNMRDRTLEYTAIVTIKCGFNERKQLETMNGWGTLSPGGKQYLCAQIDHLGIGFGNRISWEILTKMRMAKHGKTHQNTTRFHVVSSCFIRFLRMKRAASPQSLGAHGGHGSHGHTTFTYRMAVEAMSSVVKLSDPNLAVHPLLETLCDIMWKLRWTLDILRIFMVLIRDQFVPRKFKFEILQSFAVVLFGSVWASRGVEVFRMYGMYGLGESLEVESTYLSKLSGVSRTKNRHVWWRKCQFKCTGRTYSKDFRSY